MNVFFNYLIVQLGSPQAASTLSSMSIRCLRLANSLQRSFASQLISSRLPSTLTNLNPQRRAASSSNTLLPIDQETPQILPTPDDFANDVQLAGLGYPQTPNVSRQHRPAKGWWDEQDRCNYGEVVRTYLLRLIMQFPPC